ncbi:MAG: hypothetical protein ACRDRL_22270 [Sciscionella sp.]
MSEKNALYHDIQAVSRLSTELAVPETGTTRQPSALERGRREKPDGTIEDYERIEFD